MPETGTGPSGRSTTDWTAKSGAGQPEELVLVVLGEIIDQQVVEIAHRLAAVDDLPNRHFGEAAESVAFLSDTGPPSTAVIVRHSSQSCLPVQSWVRLRESPMTRDLYRRPALSRISIRLGRRRCCSRRATRCSSNSSDTPAVAAAFCALFSCFAADW
jgi:hypothetical protein